MEFKEVLCWGWVSHGGPDEIIRPCLLAAIWGSPLSQGFPCWNLDTDCAISCNWLYAEGWQISDAVPLLVSKVCLCSPHLPREQILWQTTACKQPVSFVTGHVKWQNFNGPLGRAWPHRFNALLMVGNGSTASSTCGFFAKVISNFVKSPKMLYRLSHNITSHDSYLTETMGSGFQKKSFPFKTNMFFFLSLK